MYKRKLLFVSALTALMVIGFMATSLTSYFVAQDSLSRNISEQMLPLTSDNIYSEIQRDLLRPILISSVMATDTFVRDWALTGEEDPSRIVAYLNEIQQEYDTITAFYVSEQSRQYYHPTGILKTVSEQDPDDDWYFRVRSMRDPYEVNVDTDTADRSRVSIFINYRVSDYNGQYMGATGVGLSVAAVTELIDTYQQRYNRTIYFVDRQGNVTLTGRGYGRSSRLQDRASLGAVATQVLSTPSASLEYEDSQGHKVFLNSRLVPEFDWYLIVEQDATVSEQRLDNTLLLNIGLSAAIMVLVLIIAHFTLRSYQRRLEEMATKDRLTGVANRHLFEMIFDHLSRNTQRYPRPVSLISIDIDYFKKINDIYGHQAGDIVLQAVSRAIQQHTRHSDTLCRWGGEEFILLLDNCAFDEAIKRAGIIRQAVKEQSVAFGRNQLRVTLSLGVTEYVPGEALDPFIARADAALYQAKESGRDQVSAAR
ncbi:sensor domain-containing diguanylate cyclase [Pseudohongiella sp.]|uniref:GGDEF domain-containing protein n=1 Tax=marine sediment metagenome TaxID=412755 RepID=A0A0F9W540_9ZZZZ|nr:sensor domain-containing diguanylate cyclase [Pseudohongiella sp.]HDZ07524.1 sensor domain-containing diguanylate cyclase [Pseudohongiella sp.]HEA62971.1 sensor domain-containing diguanylate cyclase [Pseudohongiella sp.]